MKDNSRISQLLDWHDYPALFYRFPILVRCVYTVNHILTLRNWYVRRALRKIEKSQSVGFSFLDAGCGMGEFALGVAKRHSHARVEGIDFTASNEPLANLIAKSMNLTNIKFYQGDLTGLRADRQYDLILCNSSLQFIKEDSLALHNLYTALKRTGVLLLYVPVTYRRYLPWSETLERKYLSDFYYKYHDDFLMHRYTSDEVLRKIQQEGFNIRSTEYAYGVCGAIAFELYSLILVGVKRFPIIWTILLVIIFACIVFPIQLLLMLIDFIIPKSIGNGVLIAAVKD